MGLVIYLKSYEIRLHSWCSGCTIGLAYSWRWWWWWWWWCRSVGRREEAAHCRVCQLRQRSSTTSWPDAHSWNRPPTGSPPSQKNCMRSLMPRLHQDTCRPETCVPGEQLISGYIQPMSTDTCHRIQVARSGYMLTVSRRHNYYSFMSRSTSIPFYPATDGRQTGNNFVADTRNMLTATSGY